MYVTSINLEKDRLIYLFIYLFTGLFIYLFIYPFHPLVSAVDPSSLNLDTSTFAYRDVSQKSKTE